MEDSAFSNWVELPEAEPVRFGDLPGLLANALHTDELWQAAAELQLIADLTAMVDAGTLRVRDPLTRAPHAFPIGESLRRAILFPSDIRPVLEARNIGLRLVRRPEFRELARPRHVDPELLTLGLNTQVLFHKLSGLQPNCVAGPASQVVAHVEEQIARQASGFFTLVEAAHIFANANAGCDVRDLIRRMMAAKVKGRRLPREPGRKLPVVEGADSFTFLLVASPEDIDAWLEDIRAPYRFPPAVVTEPEKVTTAPPETAKQRRARLQMMLDAESATGAKLGALARITEIEKRARPTADRSNMGKDIKKAREERDAERRGGALTRLLG